MDRDEHQPTRREAVTLDEEFAALATARDGRPDDREGGVGRGERAGADAAGLVKAFNSILAHHISQLARPSNAPDRTALPIAGDDAHAKAESAALIDRLGFDVVDAGPLAESWRFEPEAAAYTRLYLADPATPGQQMLQAPAAPVSAAQLRSALAVAERVRVSERAF